ncbi:hypothetical protein [Serratia fonticola]|uniref:hypothetical protein n=1 Tax=Serratia fonticola TaxID=47917 RepID=UPI0021C69F80|nr:hypothetical protein [Serratia fonticola]
MSTGSTSVEVSKPFDASYDYKPEKTKITANSLEDLVFPLLSKNEKGERLNPAVKPMKIALDYRLAGKKTAGDATFFMCLIGRQLVLHPVLSN